MKIDKKIWPQYFREIESSKKTFELRLADWECKPGDILVLREWNPKTKKYTGEILEKKISYVLKTKQIKFWDKKDIVNMVFK